FPPPAVVCVWFALLFSAAAPPEIYTLSLHDALPILLRHGFDESELHAVPPQITDRWEHYYGDNPPEIRYTGSGVVLLRTDKVDLVKETMPKVDELVRDDVLVSRSWEHQPQFIFTRLNDIKPEMIAEATQEARKAAVQFAEDSGSRVGKIRTASQGYFTIEDLDQYT